jgi:hypothetical protein
MEVLSEIPGTILFFNIVTPYFNPFIYPSPPTVDGMLTLSIIRARILMTSNI